MFIYDNKRKANLEAARQKALKTKIKCQYCLEERTISNIARHEKSCYLNPINIKRCIVCELPVKNYRTSKTCGYSCSNKHFRSGPDNPNWKESSYQSTCFHYHEKKCVVCDESRIVEVHHLDENKNNNNPSNLIPLCPTHHKYWHSRYKHLVEQKVIDYAKKWSRTWESNPTSQLPKPTDDPASSSL